MPEGMRPPRRGRQFSWCGAALSGDFLFSLLFFLDHRLKAMQEAHAKGLVLTEDGAAGPMRNEKKTRGGYRAALVREGRAWAPRKSRNGIDARRAETTGSACESPARRVWPKYLSIRLYMNAVCLEHLEHPAHFRRGERGCKLAMNLQHHFPKGEDAGRIAFERVLKRLMVLQTDLSPFTLATANT